MLFRSLWYAPTGVDPLIFRQWWSFLGPAYDDKEELKARGVKWVPEVQKWLVPSRLDFDDYTKWWPRDLKQYVFHDRFICHNLTAESGQSEVFKAWDLKDSAWVAIKLFNKAIGSNPTSETAFKREHTALLELDGHENILELLDWGEHETSQRKFTVTPWIDYTLSDLFMDEEDLIRIFYRDLERKIEWDWTEDEFVQEVLAEEYDPWLDEYEYLLGPILDGLVHAFDRDIIHRDLKPANIFYKLDVSEDEEGEIIINQIVKIGDFGAAKLMNMDVPKQTTVVDLYTEPWTPHPSEKERLFQYTWDVFSWGVIAIASVTNKSPGTYEDTQRLLDREFKQKIGENIHTLLARTVSQDPEQRPQNVKLLQKEILKLKHCIWDILLKTY